MAKSKGRLLAELLASDGKVKESKSALDIAGGKLSPSDIPTLPNSKLENSSISIAGHNTALGGSVTLNTGDIDEHTNYKYYTEARVRSAISASGDLSYNSTTGVISFSASASPVISVNSETGSVVLDTGDIAENGNLYHTTARARASISATGSLAYNSTTGVMSFTMPAQNTSNITEGSNKYYTDARVGSYLSTNGYATQSTIVGAITDSAPATLDTLNELAAALGDDANFSTTVTNSIATKLPLAGGTLTGALNAGGGINGLTLSNGISGNNFNITGVNQLTINDPGEGIVFGGGSTTMSLAIVDDATDRILRYSGTGAVFDVQGNITLTGTVTATGGNSTNWNAAYTYSQVGHVELDGTSIITGSNASNGTRTRMLWMRGKTTDSVNQINVRGADIEFGQGGTLDATPAFKFGHTGILTATGQINASGGNSAQWNAAYGWGNHASAGYVTSSGNTVIGTDTDLSFSGANVLSTIALTDGVITSYTNRVLTLANLGYTGETNATADQTASEILTAIKTVDGSGSGLDADTLDGVQLNRLSVTKSYGTGNITYGTTDSWYSLIADFSENESPITLYLKSSAHSSCVAVISRGYLHNNVANVNILASNYTQNGGYPGVSGIRVFKTTGGVYKIQIRLSYTSSTVTSFGLKCKVVGGNGSYDLPSFETSLAVDTTGGSAVGTAYTNQSSNASSFSTVPYVQSNVMWHAGNDGSGSGLDADTVDGIHAASFLRSDTADTGSGKITLTAAEGLEVFGIRGRAVGSQSGDFIQMYERVSIGYPSGWGAGGANSAPTQGLTTHGGAMFNTGNVSGAPLTFNGNTIWRADNDGSGSGLDADLLDGQHGSYYYSPGNPPPGEADTLATVTGRGASTNTAITINNQLSTTNTIFARKDNVTNYTNAQVRLDSYGGSSSTAGLGFHISGSVGRHLFMNNSGDLFWNSTASKIWHASNDGSGSGLDADLLDGQQPSQSGGANKIAQFASNGYLTVGNWIYSANSTGIYWPSGLHVYESSGNLHINTAGRYYTSAAQGRLWGASNDGSGSGLDADLLDGYQKADLNPAHSHYRWTGIAASSTQARRFVIMRLYGCPAHWDSNWQDIHLKVWSESYEATNLKYQLTGDYGGAGTQANMFQLRLKDAGGSSEHGRFRLVLGTPVDAGWDHSGADTYYVDVYAEASHYMNFTVAADFYSAGFNVNTLPTSGGATSVVYSSPAVSNITTFTEAKEHSYFANHKIWNDGNHGSASGLDADLLDGQHGSYYRAYANLTGTPTIPSLSGYATESYVGTQISNLVDSSPSALNTLNELAAALGDDANFSTTVTNSIATKMPLAGGTFTGDVIVRSGNANAALHFRTGNDFVGIGFNRNVGTGAIFDSNINAFQMHIQNNKLEFETYNGSGGTVKDAAWVLDTSGNQSITGTMLVGGQYSNNSYATVSSTRLLFGGGNDQANYHIGTNLENYGGNYTKLDLRWHTGIRMGAQAQYGGIRFFNSEDLGSVLFSIGKGDTNMRVEGGNMLFTGDRLAIFGPNSGYSRELAIGGNGNLSTTTRASIGVTNGNLHIDSASGNATYLNFYDGTSGVAFGSGNTSAVAWMGPDGDLWKGSSDNSGSKYWHAGNDGSGSGLDADTVDGLHKDFLMHYKGQVSGDWDTIFSQTDGHMGVYQVTNTTGGGHSNYPTTAYSYGGVLSWQLADSTFKLYAPHTGQLHYQTGWNNDEYSGWRKIWDTGNDGSGSGLDADLLDGQQGSYYYSSANPPPTYTKYLRSDVADSATGRITFNGNATNNHDTIATGTGSQGGLEVYNSGAGNDAFMAFHAGADYALYFGLDADTNKLAVGGWSMGAVKHAIYHEGNKPSLATLGYTGATNANYITNNNQLTNGAGYVTGTGSITESHRVSGNAFATTGAPGSVLEYQQASGQTDTRLAPSSDWHNTIRMGHGNPYNYYSNTIAMQMTGTGAGKIRTQLISNNSAAGWRTIWDSTTDGSGSGLDADLLDGQHGSYYAPASHNHSGVYTPYDHFSHTGHGNYTSTTTSALLTEALGDNAFDSKLTAHKTSWSYAGNGNLTDAGRFTELAGSSWLWWTDNSADNVQGYITALAIAPTTGGSGGKMFVYNNQGPSYNPGWREIWTSTSDGSGSGLDADLLDGQHGSYYQPAGSYLTAETLSSTNSPTVTGTKYFQPAGSATSPLGGGGGASLQAYTTGTTAAYMAFHRSGAYAINWGLDTSNTMVLGGWSSSTTAARMSIGTNGLMVTAGQGNLWGAGNDGSGSGLDADTVRGSVPSFTDTNTNFPQTGQTWTLASGYSVAQGDWGLRNSTPSGWIQFGPANTSHAHIYTDRSNFYFNVNTMYQNGHLIWAANNDGSGSGLDADTVDGKQGSNLLSILSGGTAASVDSYTDNGVRAISYTGFSKHLLSWNAGGSTGSVQQEFDYTPGRGWRIRTKTDNNTWQSWAYVNLSSSNQGVLTGTTWTSGNDGSGSGLDADLLDGVNSGSFLRSDTGDTIDNNVVIAQRGEFTTGTSGQNNSRQAGTLSYSYGYQFGGAWTSPFPDLVLGYHTGVRIGGYYGYGGTRFYDDHPSRTSTIIFSVANGDAHVRATNNIYAYTSDIRLKENFRPIENAVDKVKAIGGFIFDWRKDMMEKHDFTPDQQQDDAGLIAQEVQKVMPAAIKRAPFDHDLTKPNQSKSGEDFLTVQYEKMVPLLVEAIKEQQKQIDELKKLLENK